MPEQKQIAYKVSIKDILNGSYVKEEGWNLNYLNLPDGRKVSKINLIAAIIENHENGYAVLEDGTGTIAAREFEKSGSLSKFNAGEIVMIIGRTMDYDSERYVLPEIVKKIENPAWFQLRKLELSKIVPVLNETPAPKENTEEENMAIEEDVIETQEKEIAKDNVIDFIRENDKGEGVDLTNFMTDAAQKTHIEMLLKEGEIFEIRPGRYKVLE